MAVVFKKMEHFKTNVDYVHDDRPYYKTCIGRGRLPDEALPLWLMDDAFVKTKGSIISPNLNFMGQLCGNLNKSSTIRPS
jgi:hypothetical protein